MRYRLQGKCRKERQAQGVDAASEVKEGNQINAYNGFLNFIRSRFTIDGFVISKGWEEKACEANFGVDRAAHMRVERV